MKCPHCLDSYHSDPDILPFAQDSKGSWAISHEICPSCTNVIVKLIKGQFTKVGQRYHIRLAEQEILVYPKAYSRIPVAPEVTAAFAIDYKEACLVLADSSKASAALSRRCLQHILREKAGITQSNLANEIQQALDSNKLPSYLMESLDAVRNIGNFAAHSIKSTSTGEVVDVEPGEAEWNLDVIEALFDFYFVQPEAIKKKRANLNKKLGDAGKPQLK